ncbi:hypothetical protein ASD66_19285 [Nocardioides sp. Root151]|nr:hypothetical protein ASD66_19285 [Nocardioides sp. Root151]
MLNVTRDPDDRARRARARELARLMKELDEADRRGGLGTWPPPARPRRTHTRRTTLLLSGTITLLVLSIVVALHPGPQASALRRVLGFGDERILAAPDVPDTGGSYQFVETQRDGKTPVGYDPCKKIEIEINPEDAPDGYEELVEDAARHTSSATGLAFDIVGTTDDRPTFEPSVPRREPVLVAWASEDEVEELADDVAGVAGSQRTTVGGRLYYVTGHVVLDTEVFGDEDVDRDQLQAVVDHEFGHLVGLAHVDDPSELMYAESVGVTRFGPGDLRGLALIGRVPCQ